ncbi:MAG TPA: hypothetical protein PKO15_04505 [Fibrobacteria bacterium]|nr:hypothetical protein [Fibrobacteria bacterium]HOX50561.1 hypothetical protein [Fibrobacteria bacterium]
MRILPRILIACALGLAACDRGTAPPDGLVQGDDESLQWAVAGIQDDLSRLRNLPFDAPVISRWVKRERLMVLLDSIEAANPGKPDTTTGPHPTETELFVALDLMDAAKSAEEEQRKFDGDNIGGFYVTGTGKFWLVEDPDQPEEVSYTLIAHELAHALQNLNFWDTLRRGAGYDEHLALQHLVEGEAEYLGDLWSLRPSTIEAFEAKYRPITLDFILDAARNDHPTTPLALTLPIYSHYWVGEWSIHDQRKALGWSSIDELHRNAPRSTKRMLHPFAGADALTIAEWPEDVFRNRPGLVPLGSDRLGEVYLAAMLHWRAPSLAWRSSSWKGDRFWLWRAGDSLHHIAAGRIRFETAADATQFLSKWAAGRGLVAKIDGEFDSLEAPRGDTGRVRAVRRGGDVSLMYGSHPDRWPAYVADSIWSELADARPTSLSAARRAPSVADPSKASFPPFPSKPVHIWKEYLRSRP